VRLSAQLHSLGKIRHPAAAAVDADDVYDIEMMVGNLPGQLFAALTFASVAIDM
jgi:hypothetical protein